MAGARCRRRRHRTGRQQSETELLNNAELDPVGALILQLLEKSDFSGTMTDLLAALHQIAPPHVVQYMPHSASTLSNSVKRLTPSLLVAGVTCERRKVRGDRRVTLRRAARAEGPS